MVTVDLELKKLIVALSEKERAALKASIEENGFNPAFPIILWKGHDTIVDGHNRYECCEELGVTPVFVEQEFENKEAVMVWMVKAQLARRNLTPEQLSTLRGSRFNVEKAGHGGSRGKNCHLKTDEKLASEYGVSPRTIRNDWKFSESIDKISEACNISKNDLLGKFRKADIMTLGSYPTEQIPKGLKKLEEDGHLKDSKPKSKCAYYLQFDSDLNDKILKLSKGDAQLFFEELINEAWERRND
jgi:hypothetical protein